jgi:hypothetical protein
MSLTPPFPPLNQRALKESQDGSSKAAKQSLPSIGSVNSSLDHRFHPYQSKSKSNAYQEILSPALSQQCTPSSAQKPPTIWDDFATILSQAMGPYKVPVNKLYLPKFLRPHSMEDIAALAYGIEEDDRRSLQWIIVEIDQSIISDPHQRSLLATLQPHDHLPTDILDGCKSVGFVIHGGKRCRAIRLLDDDYVCVKFVAPGRSSQ